MAQRLRACHCCGQIHALPPLLQRQRARCVRCHAKIATADDGRLTASRTAAAAAAAFVLYWPAMFLPILEIEKLGHHHKASIVVGTYELFSEGNFFVGFVVLVFSIVFPLVKIVGLLELSLLGVLHKRHKAITYRFMEAAGRWSMMDVMLLAFLVMLVKLGELVEFHFGPAVFAFVLCVAFSMIASMLFDPHSIWEDEQA